MLPPGVLVWARAKGFPAFPAEIADPRDKKTPQGLINDKPAKAEELGLIPVSGCAAGV